MGEVTYADQASANTDAGRGQGSQVALSPLPAGGLCALALERDSRAEATVDFGGDNRTPEPLLGGSPRSDAGIRGDLSPSIGQRWMSFAGIKAAQILADYWLWEAVLNDRSANGIVELGTGAGGFSCYLNAQAETRGMFFRTYDIFVPEHRVPGFVQIDIYAMAEEIGSHLRRHDPLILFCDGGNKPRELGTFSRYLSPDSTIIVHDWKTEILSHDVPDNVIDLYPDLCDEIGSMSRCFRVVV